MKRKKDFERFNTISPNPKESTVDVSLIRKSLRSKYLLLIESFPLNYDVSGQKITSPQSHHC